MIKSCASIDKCRAEILIAYIKIIQPIYRKYKKDAVITSGSENYKHSVKHSRHYSGDALDLRSKFFTEEQKDLVLDELKRKLGKHFVVILEGRGKPWEHFHIHYAPVYED